jgi:hypothetical protein
MTDAPIDAASWEANGVTPTVRSTSLWSHAVLSPRA